MKTIKDDIKLIKSEVNEIGGRMVNVELKIENVELITTKIEKKIRRRGDKHESKSQASCEELMNAPCNLSKSIDYQNEVDNRSSFVDLLTNSLTSDDITDFIAETESYRQNNEETDKYDDRTDIEPINRLLNKNVRRKTNKCACFIKNELVRVYSQDELANGRLVGGKRKYMNLLQEKSALSPGRMATILNQAKKKYRDEYEAIQNMNEVINSKCRQVKSNAKKSLELF